VAVFKHICGEYDTATGFALWLGNHSIIENAIPNQMLLQEPNKAIPEVRKVLIVNHFILGTASIILLTKQ
jgi:hypothetical protein